MKKYYVYEWYNVDTGEIFYVGTSGAKYRYKQYNPKQRNKNFTEYYNTHNCSSRIIKNNLTQEEGWNWEIKFIEKYKYENQPLTNLTPGGYKPPIMYGEDNPMFGNHHTDETKEKLKTIHSDGRHAGENNSQYGISPKERMSSEVYERWIEKHQEKTGDKNPNFGNTKLSEYYTEHPEEALRLQSRKGIDNGRATPIKMLSSKGKLIKEFAYIRLCAEYLIDLKISNSKNINSLYSNIWKANKNDSIYLGYKFSY